MIYTTTSCLTTVTHTHPQTERYRDRRTDKWIKLMYIYRQSEMTEMADKRVRQMYRQMDRQADRDSWMNGCTDR